MRTAADRLVAKKDRHGQTVISAVRWVMESKSISHLATVYPHVRFVNTTDGGIGFEKIEYTPLDKAIENLSTEFDIRGLIHAAIASAPIPATKSTILAKMDGLKESLERSITCLQILAKEVEGSTALAELDLKEEDAYAYLFYDMPQVLPQMAKAAAIENPWVCFLKLARQYLAVF